VDATNAFNCLNQQVALRNIFSICSSFAQILINMYRVDSLLYIDDDLYSFSGGHNSGGSLDYVNVCSWGCESRSYLHLPYSRYKVIMHAFEKSEEEKL